MSDPKISFSFDLEQVATDKASRALTNLFEQLAGQPAEEIVDKLKEFGINEPAASRFAAELSHGRLPKVGQE